MNLWKLVQKIFGLKPADYTDPVTMWQKQVKVIAWDFDGTIAQWRFPEGGAPMVYGFGGKTFTSVDLMRAARAAGYKNLIHTSRVNAHWPADIRMAPCVAMIRWLEEHDAPFDAIWGMRFKDGAWEFSNEDVGKPVCCVYFDDFGFRADDVGAIQLQKIFADAKEMKK